MCMRGMNAALRCLAVALTVLGLSITTLPAEAAEFRKGPYLQNVSQSSITLVWEVARKCSGEVRVWGRDFERTLPVAPGDADDDMHELLIDGLAPGQRYRYQVTCQGSERGGEFSTGPEAGTPFMFVVLGDSRSNAGAHGRIVERVRNNEVPDFIVSTGDLVDDGGSERQWQEFFDIERELLADNVLFPSLGNHDRQGRGRTADSYRRYFSLPENAPDPERYYAFTYSSARFLILDSNAYSFSLTDQTAWIESELQRARLDPDIEHIFVSMHHPPFSIALHGGQEELRERWTPLFERYGVTAVFSGHDHVYSRAIHNDIRYFVTGGAGAPVYPRSRSPSPEDLAATVYFERTHHYVRVHVMGSFIELSAIRSDGTRIETVSWGERKKRRVPPLVAAADRADPIHMQGTQHGQSNAMTAAVGAPVAEPASTARITSADTSGGGGIGLLGSLGGAMMILAAGGLLWTLRS